MITLMRCHLFRKLLPLGLAACLTWSAAGLCAPPAENAAEAQAQQPQPKPGEQKPETPAAPAQAQPKPAEPKPEAAAAPAQPAPAAPAVPPGSARISLQLQNADLLQVINIIAAELQLNYIVDPAVRGTVTISTLGELRREDLLPILEAILKINGATAIRTGNFFRVVPLARAPQIPVEISRDRSPGQVPTDDRMMLQVVPLHFVSAGDMGKILGEFVGDGGKIVVHDQGNILLILDSSLNMRRLLELLALFDSEVFAGERVRLFPVKNNQASSLVKELETIFAAYALSEQKSALRFVPIDRINSILVVSPSPESYAEVEKWIAKLDTPVVRTGIQTFVYKVQNSDAANLARILAQVYSGGGFQPSPALETGRGGGRTAGAEVTMVTTSDMRIVPDPINNLLIIQTTAQNFERIKQALVELDIVPRQVLIEAKVYEVNLTGALSFGVSAFLQSLNDPQRQQLPGGGHKGQASFDAGVLAAAFGTFIGHSRELLFFLNAQENRSRVKVLSAPVVLASDNTDAFIQVGAEVPILTSQAVAAGTQVGGTSLFTNTVQSRDTGVILKVKPRINAGGLVTLLISQEVSTPQAPAPGGIQSPTIQKRSVSTQVVVQNGETIAIGGIMQESTIVSKNRVPLLGDIPVLGALFGSTTYSKQKTELIVLLTPRVIEEITEASVQTEELKARLKELRKTFRREELR